MKISKSTKNITFAAVIAALYTVLTFVFSFASSGVIQVRVAEALCILPCFTPYAIPGVTVGCLLANFLVGGMPYDIVFGTLATLIGAVGTYLLRKNKFLAVLPPIVSNTLIVPQILKLVYGAEEAVPFLMLTVFIGEVLSVGVLGLVLYTVMKKYENRLF